MPRSILSDLLSQACATDRETLTCEDCKTERTVETTIEYGWKADEFVVSVIRSGIFASDSIVAPPVLDLGGRRFCLQSVACRRGNNITQQEQNEAYAAVLRGHWVSYVRRGTSRGGSWYYCNDSVVTAVDRATSVSDIVEVRRKGCLFWYALDTSMNTRSGGAATQYTDR